MPRPKLPEPEPRDVEHEELAADILRLKEYRKTTQYIFLPQEAQDLLSLAEQYMLLLEELSEKPPKPEELK